MSEAIEQWRPVVGWEGLYEVSDLGRVRSLDRWVTTPNRWGSTTRYRKPGRVLAQKRKKEPTRAYAVVILSRDGETETYAVHTLVLEAWVAPRPPGAWARHGPLGLQENGVANLSWGTPKENAQDRLCDGHDAKSNETHCPWTHRLAEPNLDPSMATRGFRRCRACALTQLWGNTHDCGPGDHMWLVEADRRYAEILRFSKPIDYRKKANGPWRRPRWTRGDDEGWDLD